MKIVSAHPTTKTFSISILSDLHLDFYFRSHRQNIEEVKKFFDPIFMPINEEGVQQAAADVLVIAGDIGHYNHENAAIIAMLKELYFKHILCVLGNHDYYLVNRIQLDDYEGDSFTRVSQMRELLNAIEGVHCLNADVKEILGVRFGGCDSWYDGLYLLKNLNPHNIYALHHVRENWKYMLNDAKLIFQKYRQLKHFDDIWEIEKQKIEAIHQSCDVMITHVMPSIDPMHVESHYRGDKATAYFCFDGEQYVKNTSAHTWVFGHSHVNTEFEWHGVHLIANQMGYPGEMRRITERRINVPIPNKSSKDEK